MELTFSNISVLDGGDYKVVNDGCFTFKSGQICCVLSLEALAKTLILSAFSGRRKFYDGRISLNGTTITHAHLQNQVVLIEPRDLFLPTLTVHETLMYTALLRQPASQEPGDTRKIVEEMKTLAGLTNFTQCPVQFATQLTKTRLHIACELLQMKHFYIIQDPFENLGFEESFELILMLRKVCSERHIGFVVSTSSAYGHVIDKCDILTCMHLGEILYNGRPDKLRYLLCKAGLQLSPIQSPVEQLLSLLTVNADDNRSTDLMKIIKQQQSSNVHHHSWQTPVDPWTRDQNHVIRETVLIGDGKNDSSDVKLSFEDTTLLNGTCIVEGTEKTHMTSIVHQIWRLTQRNFSNARRRILFPVNMLQNVYILVICTLVWWRPDRNESTVKDRAGLFFFTTVQWAFFALLDAVLSFPKEMIVILREQKSHLYRMSAFCISKTLSELPLAILQPCVYMTVIYWVANLRGGVAFVESLGILVVDVIAAQSIGLLIGAAIEPPKTFMIMSLGLLSMMLWGGAFCTPPTWLRWGKFASFFTYGLDAFIDVEFHDGSPIECSVSSMVPVCNMINPETNSTHTHFPSNIVLTGLGVTWSAWENVTVLLVVTIVTRLLWYACLRMKLYKLRQNKS